MDGRKDSGRFFELHSHRVRRPMANHNPSPNALIRASLNAHLPGGARENQPATRCGERYHMKLIARVEQSDPVVGVGKYRSHQWVSPLE